MKWGRPTELNDGYALQHQSTKQNLFTTSSTIPGVPVMTQIPGETLHISEQYSMVEAVLPTLPRSNL